MPTTKGSMTIQFTSPVAATATNGASTDQRFSLAKSALNPVLLSEISSPNSVLVVGRGPGNVSASITGMMVCMPKYTGKMACWRVENWARGRARKATMPFTKDCELH